MQVGWDAFMLIECLRSFLTWSDSSAGLSNKILTSLSPFIPSTLDLAFCRSPSPSRNEDADRLRDLLTRRGLLPVQLGIGWQVDPEDYRKMQKTHPGKQFWL